MRLIAFRRRYATRDVLIKKLIISKAEIKFIQKIS